MSAHVQKPFPVAAARLARLTASPRAVAVASVLVLTAFGWLSLAMLSAGTGDIWGALCSQTGPATLRMGDVGLIVGMWLAMTPAMMVPSAAPMIMTYADIADAAARKGETIISPLVLTAGYVVVWLIFAFAIALAQAVAGTFAGETGGPVSRVAAGFIFEAAGLYQFSALKQACLHQCRQPFQFFFTNWKTTALGVFRLGVQQGVFCLGCCWAAMAVMAAVGVMNIVWMVGLAVVMILEKLTTGRWLSCSVGGALIAVGLGFILSATTGLF